jgi:predicted ABC-type ATPase
MPRVIIIGGPNGAGKTTFANWSGLAGDEGIVFVNADQIALELPDLLLTQQQLDRRAGRAMLQRIDELVTHRADFMFETTLATLLYARRIRLWRDIGYSVVLVYLRLRTVEHSIARVRSRVEAGGHGIPEETIRRRFAKGLFCLRKIYLPIVDEWYIWDSPEGEFEMVEHGARH